MRLLCPQCGKAHLIRDGALGKAGRSVRCSSCKSTWFANASGQARGLIKAATAPAQGEISSQAIVEHVRKATSYKPTKSQKQGQSGRSRFLIDPGLAILGMLALTLGMGLLFRETAVRSVPDLASLYRAFGYSVNVRGLEFAGLTSSREIQNGEAVLVVEGKISNISRGPVPVPPVRVTLRSPTGTEIETAIVRPEAGALDYRGETGFKTMLANPPEDAKDVLVHFIDPQNSGRP